jgi:acetyltransferase
LRAAARNKPVIVVKAGRAGHGVQAAASHTGAMAGSDIVFDAAIRRAGMLRVDTLQELFMAAQTLARMRDNRSECLTIMTNGGGGGVMAADAAARIGVTLFDPDVALLQQLDAVLPATWSRANPIDIIGDAPVERYAATLSALLAREDSGAVLFLHAPTAIVPSADIARACLPIAAPAARRVMGCWLGDAAVSEARQIFQGGGIADYATPEDAVSAFSMLVTYRRNQALLLEAPAASHNAVPDLAAARSVVQRVLGVGRAWLTEPEAKAVLQACGVPVARTVVTPPDANAAAAAAREIGYPVVLKIVSEAITHKTDVGGVRLRLMNEAELREAALTMLERVRRERPDAVIEGFAVQAMVVRPMAQELIVGTSVDPLFGPVLLFGQGGTAVEVVQDRAIALPPLNRTLAAELVSRTRVAKLLAGYRDHPSVKLDAVYDALAAVSQMLVDLPELAELDINPLLADADGVIALDARIRVSGDRPAGAMHFAIRPYPARLSETIAWNGTSLVLRPIRPEDETQHRQFLEQLDAEDIRMRVFYSRRELPRSELARLTQIDYEREMAIIAERLGPGGQPETLGTVRLIADPDNNRAEFAVIVRSDCKGAGLGRILLEKIIRYARERGTRTMVGTVLRENTAMLGLARACGFVNDPSQAAEGGVISLMLALQPHDAV